MKKLFILSFMLCLLGGNRVWADYLYFANNWYDNTDDWQTPFHNYTVQRGANDTEDTEYEIKIQLKYWSSGATNGNLNGNNSYEWNHNDKGDVHSSIITDANGRKTIRVKGKGGAVVIDANGTDPQWNNQYYHTFCVITLPPLDNYVWDFFGESAESEGHILRHPQYNVSWTDKVKVKDKLSDATQIVKAADVAGGRTRGSHTQIDGTNAFYLPSTAGMVFDAAEGEFGYYHDNHLETKVKNTFVEREFVSFGGSRNGTPSFTLPQVKAGKYIKVWCNAQAKGNGGQFTVTGLLDLDGNSIDNPFTFAGVTYYGECLGCLIFKVKDSSTHRQDVTFTLQDHLYWNDIYKIEITDEYSTDLELADITKSLTESSAWSERNYVKHNNQYAHIVHDGSGVDLLYSGVAGVVYIQRGCTCDFEVYPEGGVSIGNWELTSGSYHDLKLNNVKGTGNIRIIVKEVFGGDNKYVLDKKEAWIAVGEYKQQTYPYTWDFMDWNMKQKKMLGVLDDSNNHGISYGYWNTTSDNVRSLETHEHVAASKVNNENVSNYVWNNVLVDRPLFAQGAQLSYRYVDDSKNIDEIRALKEAEGLRVKQFWGKEMGSGSSYDNEISLDGNYLSFNPTTTGDDGHKLVITIPNVPKKEGEEMWLFIKASTQPNGVYASTNTSAQTLTADSKETGSDTYNTKDDVWAYKITSAGDVEILYSKAVNIAAIGVTNIFKSINDLGYATESRNVAIDHEYEGVFTKNDVNAYCIQTYANDGFTYEYKGLPEVKKSTRVYLVPKNTGIVLYADVKNSEGKFNVPLFYPACNNTSLPADEDDPEVKAFRNNWMAPWVNDEQHYNDQIQKEWAMHRYDDNANDYKDKGEWCQKFVMSSKFYVYHKTGDGTGSYSSLQTSTDPTSGEPAEAFYRMNLNLANTGVSGTSNVMGANKAYLLIPSSKMPKALWNDGDGNGNAGSSKNGIIFMDLEDIFGPEDLSGVATSIDAIESADSVDNGNTYYTLSGMKIQGRPTEKGVYIMNGKKVLVK